MRFAVYYAPDPSGLLHQLGSQWLGRDAFSGGACIQPDAQLLAEITAEPRRYGFHATLKPPFALKEQLSSAALEAAVSAVAESFQPFDMILRLQTIDGFLALVPAGDPQQLEQLAAACVRDLDGFRQTATDTELARRRAAGLSERQDSYLERWGYPYVLEEFRFHMTLSRRLSQVEMQEVMPLAGEHFAAVLGRPIPVDALTLFIEPQQGAPFEAHSRFPFQAFRAEAAP